MNTYRVRTIVTLMLFGFGVNESIAQPQPAAYDSAPEFHIQAAVQDAQKSAAPPASSSTMHIRSSYWDNWLSPETVPSSSSHVRLSGYWEWHDHHWVWKPDPRYVK